MLRIYRLWIATLFLAAAQAWAQYPAKAVTLVVPFPPGGSNDVFARAVAKKLSDAWSQPVVVENKPGAGGMIGAAGVSKAPADGYTLLFVSSSYTTGAAVQPLPFDPIAGLTPIASVSKGPMVLTVKNGVPVKNAAELVALAKSQPGKLNYGSAGPGSINHFAGELLAQSAGVKMTHVPYKGMGPATADLIGGHIDVLVASSPSVMQHVKAGKVTGLGVTSAKASPLVPGLEPVADAVKGYEVELWWGMLGPPARKPRAHRDVLEGGCGAMAPVAGAVRRRRQGRHRALEEGRQGSEHQGGVTPLRRRVRACPARR
jgi:tripartite-type tricarboxylate transporter receptor subunit TctC